MKKVEIGGIEFPPCLAASGAMGNFSENYFHHSVFSKLGLLNKSGTTFVSKTATLNQRDGNMPYENGNNFGPKELMPSCIKVDLLTGNTLNAVGLSNPGLEAFLKTNKWQQLKDSFWISIMSIAGSAEERKAEMEKMIELIIFYKQCFSTNFGLQINLSCPNTSHDPCVLMSEANDMINIAAKSGVPIMAKFNITVPIDALLELEKNPNLDAICLSNTIPFGWDPYYNSDVFNTFRQGGWDESDIDFRSDKYEQYRICNINWKKRFGKESPLKKFGGGGLSGPVIKPFVLHYISELRKAGFKKHINGGGGISCADDVDLYKKAGADSIFYGSVANTRPWQVSKIIKRANEIF